MSTTVITDETVTISLRMGATLALAAIGDGTADIVYTLPGEAEQTDALAGTVERVYGPYPFGQDFAITATDSVQAVTTFSTITANATIQQVDSLPALGSPNVIYQTATASYWWDGVDFIAMGSGAAGAFTSLSVSGAITGGGLVDISAAGAGQIKFPATQNPSGNANTLDDYEEGTWTATIVSSGGGSAVVAASAVYTKIGNVVNIGVESFNVDLSGLSAGDLTITGLPFACSASCPAIAYFDIAGAVTAAQGAVVAYASNSTTIQLMRSQSTAATLTALTVADLNANVSIRFNGSYPV